MGASGRAALRGVNTGRRGGAEEEDAGAPPGSVPGQPDSLGELSTPLGELSTPDSLRAESIWLSTAAETQAATKVLSRP